MISVLAHVPLPAEIAGATAGVAVLAFGAVWVTRAAARYVTARGGQNWETVLLLAFFAAAASLSAHGLIGFASHNMGLWGPFPVIFWLALDGAAGMLLSMIRRRARAARSIWHVRVVTWLIIAASAAFNWMHAPSLAGAHLAWAAMPVIAGVLAELAVADIRQEAREEARRKLGPLPSRRVEIVRWLHPVEMFKVMSVMTANSSVASADATREVRADAAARALYRLRRTMSAAGISGSGTQGRMTRRGKVAVRIAEFIAQAAFRRAGFAAAGAAPEDILRRVQVLVRIRDFASLDYGTAENARNVIESLISGTGHGAVPPSGRVPEPAGTGGTDGRHGPAPTSGTDAGTGTPAPARASGTDRTVPVARTAGTDEAAPAPTSGTDVSTASAAGGTDAEGGGARQQPAGERRQAVARRKREADPELCERIVREFAAAHPRPGAESIDRRLARAGIFLAEFRERTGERANNDELGKALGVHPKRHVPEIRAGITEPPEGERSEDRREGTG
jgi:hypothetical protein